MLRRLIPVARGNGDGAVRRSTTNVGTPRRPSVIAVTRPDGPAPTTRIFMVPPRAPHLTRQYVFQKTACLPRLLVQVHPGPGGPGEVVVQGLPHRRRVDAR